MSWIYENGQYLGNDAKIASMADGFVTVDSIFIPDAITLGLFKRDGWEIYNGTVHKDESHAVFKYRTTYKKVI
jgi:hypothetical protein